jgi:hypothetical protein
VRLRENFKKRTKPKKMEGERRRGRVGEKESKSVREGEYKNPKLKESE